NEVIRNGERDLYNLNITLLYSTDEDPTVALETAERAATGINVAFRQRCFHEAEGWKWIELSQCEVISDEAMTYKMAMLLKRWNMDYLSLRAEPQEERIPE